MGVDKTAIHVMHRRSIYSNLHCLNCIILLWNYFQNGSHIDANWMLWSCQMVMDGASCPASAQWKCWQPSCPASAFFLIFLESFAWNNMQKVVFNLKLDNQECNAYFCGHPIPQYIPSVHCRPMCWVQNIAMGQFIFFHLSPVKPITNKYYAL